MAISGFGFFVTAAVLACLNLKKGRCDRKGAWRIMGAVFLLAMIHWLFTASHVVAFWEFHLMAKGVGWALVLATLFGLLYLGVEPHIRRHWPDSLISWSRLHARQFTDPLVASHIIAGITAILVAEVAYSWSAWLVGRYFRDLLPAPLVALNSVPMFFGAFSGALGSPFYLIMLFAPLARLFARKRLWLADGAAAVLAALFSFTFYQSVWQDLVNGCCTVLFNLILLWLLRRFGLLAAFVALMTDVVIGGVMPIELGSWYGGRGLALLCIPALAALWATWVIASGPRLQAAESA